MVGYDITTLVETKYGKGLHFKEPTSEPTRKSPCHAFERIFNECGKIEFFCLLQSTFSTTMNGMRLCFIEHISLMNEYGHESLYLTICSFLSTHEYAHVEKLVNESGKSIVVFSEHPGESENCVF